MKIALLGYGNMGNEIDVLLSKTNKHQITSISFKDRLDGFDEKGVGDADVVIDFTAPEAVLDNIKQVMALGKNMVIGTSGWYDHLDEVKSWVEEANIGLIYAQNFSIGTNILFKLVAEAAKMADKFGKYDVMGLEIHHTGKKDSPSGTALKLGEVILENFPQKKTIQTDKLDRKIEPSELHFASLRGGRNPGMHQVIFDSEGDQITLEIAAHNRKTYAQGAILAAEYIFGKTGIYSFDELFK